MAEGETGEGGLGGGIMELWRKRFTEFLRKGPSEPGKRMTSPAAPLQRTESFTPLQDVRDKKI